MIENKGFLRSKNKNNTISGHRKKSTSLRWNAKNKSPQPREKKKKPKIFEETSTHLDLQNITIEELKKMFNGMHLKDILDKLGAAS